MNLRTALAAFAATLTLAGPLSAPAQAYEYGAGYNSGRSDFFGGTNLSRCGRNAVIGAGVGVLAGAVLGGDNRRLGNAALGAVLGGAGTYLACRYLGNRDRNYISSGYGQALTADAPFRGSYLSDGFGARSVLNVSQPIDAGGNCRLLNAFLQLPDGGTQMLPQERFCRGADGQWRAVS